MAVTVNLDALKDLTQKVNRGSGLQFVGHKDINPDLDVRLVQSSRDNMNGIPFFAEEGYWINGVRYISPATFGETCPIAEEVEEARAKKDEQLDRLIKSQNFNQKRVILATCVVIETDDRDNQIGVQDDTVKILQVGPQLAGAMITTMGTTKRRVASDFVRCEGGYNLLLSKKGTKMQTQYFCSAWPDATDIDPKFGDDENIPDIVEMTRKKLMPNSYLRGVIRNYLYGEPMPEKPERQSNNNSSDDEDEKPTPKAETAKPKGGTGRRKLIDEV